MRQFLILVWYLSRLVLLHRDDHRPNVFLLGLDYLLGLRPPRLTCGVGGGGNGKSRRRRGGGPRDGILFGIVLTGGLGPRLAFDFGVVEYKCVHTESFNLFAVRLFCAVSACRRLSTAAAAALKADADPGLEAVPAANFSGVGAVAAAGVGADAAAGVAEEAAAEPREGAVAAAGVAEVPAPR